MPLTARQRYLLEQYRSYRHTPPTVGSLMARVARLYLLILVCILGVIGIFYLSGGGPFAGLLIGLLVGLGLGSALRDLGYCRGLVRFWPTFQQIIDWPRLEQLLADPAPAGPADRPAARG